MNSHYIGRFAPSPTGELHFGSLVAAVASYADAKHHNGSWLLRIDDIDQPRKTDGSSELIIDALSAFEMAADEEIEKLIGSTELEISFHHNGVIPLEQRI